MYISSSAICSCTLKKNYVQAESSLLISSYTSSKSSISYGFPYFRKIVLSFVTH
ncbi:hypothetical protein B7P43_G15463 [Cryptotermes secundus]|uniref:Uncharacterized protein n=1 Tax=Cryptotermes secundus TaxID=105785 RepID=A0A2J7QVM9_9NEOP|nr:hypothetical protein B7P43_G15463 [Cryptotermes secundus]